VSDTSRTVAHVSVPVPRILFEDTQSVMEYVTPRVVESLTKIGADGQRDAQSCLLLLVIQNDDGNTVYVPATLQTIPAIAEEMRIRQGLLNTAT